MVFSLLLINIDYHQISLTSFVQQHLLRMITLIICDNNFYKFQLSKIYELFRGDNLAFNNKFRVKRKG